MPHKGSSQELIWFLCGEFRNPLCDLRSSRLWVGSLLSLGTCRGAECETDLPNLTESHSRRNSFRGKFFFRHTSPSWRQSTLLQRHYLAGHWSVTLCIPLGWGENASPCKCGPWWAHCLSPGTDHVSPTCSPPGWFMRPAATFVNNEYIIKISQ
jgi:hypothetical protein